MYSGEHSYYTKTAPNYIYHVLFFEPQFPAAGDMTLVRPSVHTHLRLAVGRSRPNHVLFDDMQLMQRIEDLFPNLLFLLVPAELV